MNEKGLDWGTVS